MFCAHGGREHGSEPDRIGQLIEQGRLREAERLLRAHPDWIHDDEAGWGDGSLAGPTRDGRHDILEMLMRLGARVPPVSNWAAAEGELCRVNDSVVRLGIMQGEYHWHSHKKESEIFSVLEGRFVIELEDRETDLAPGQGTVIPRGVRHPPRAPVRSVVLVVETESIVPTGS